LHWKYDTLCYPGSNAREYHFNVLIVE